MFVVVLVWGILKYEYGSGHIEIETGGVKIGKFKVYGGNLKIVWKMFEYPQERSPTVSLSSQLCGFIHIFFLKLINKKIN